MPVPSTHIRVRRGAAKGRYERASVDAVLDRAAVAHVAVVDGAVPVCLPMLYARVGDALYVHGSRASRLIRRLGTGAPTCVTVTALRGLVLARSAFEHSANYESAMIFGSFDVVEDDDEQVGAFEAFTEKLLPGRWSEVRPPSAKELKGSAILRLDLARSQSSVKVRSGPPDDDDTPDASTDVWAGVLPIVSFLGRPEPSPRLRRDIALSASVSRAIRGQRWV